MCLMKLTIKLSSRGWRRDLRTKTRTSGQFKYLHYDRTFHLFFLSPSPVSSVSRSSADRLPERVRHLETLVDKQMRMIQEQQSIIEQQKCLLDNRRNGKKIGNGNPVSLEESLEELIDREENGFDTDEDDNMN